MGNTTMQPQGEVRYLGLDVSARSGEVDFATLKQSGRSAVYIRASVAGDYADPNMDANYIAARENGLLVGFYHVLTARTTAEALSQAQFFLETIADREMQLRPAMDFDCLAGLTPAAANDVALTFLEAVEAGTGKGAAVYTDACRARTLWSEQIARRYPLWLAAPDAAAQGGAWAGWSGLQYAVGRVEGAQGRVGLDRFTDGMLAAQDAPAAVPTLASASALASAAQTYTVQRGDTLSGIAARFGTTVAELVRLNNIADPDRIYEGDRLIIRARGESGGTTTYVVQRNDNLTSIAARFGTTVAELVRLNNIANPDRIYEGQVLIVPQSGSVTPPEGTTTYVVQRNDNLTSIAARFGTTVAELVRLNNIANPDRIYEGQVLIVPQSGSVTPPEGTTTYVVQRNDNLTSIAARFGTTVAELVRLNNIADPDLIYEGQVLLIPQGGASGGTITYTVRAGDTLSEIAARYGTTVTELVRLNGIADRDRIYVGQVLLIPQGGCVDTYIVQSGDTLTQIASRFGTTVARLAGINGIRNTDRIYVGQVLTLGVC